MDEKISVYVKTDTNNIIIEITSSVFLKNITGYTKVAEGYGDTYAHASNQYLDKGLADDLGRYNYKLSAGQIVELTEDEKSELFPLTRMTIKSFGSDYGEIATWMDGNSGAEDRLFRFVTISGSARNIAFASSTSQIVGTSNKLENVGFIGNYKPGDETDTSRAVVSILGVSYVKTNDSTIVANDRVMSDDSGYAIKSSNNLGYRVLSVPEEGLLEIVISPNTDMIQRIKTDMFNYNVGAAEPTTETCPDGYFYFKISE